MQKNSILPPYILLTEKQQLPIKGIMCSGLCRLISIQEN